MPPKAKFTKEEIINSAVMIIREKGIGALTARELGEKLGSSARPIFTTFQNMEEVQQGALMSIRGLYNEYVQDALKVAIPFKAVGMAYIAFAQQEPKLFQLLFMKENTETLLFEEVLAIIDENYKVIMAAIQKDYGMNEVSASKLYQHLWVYTHGIATLCATKVCSFSDEQIGQMLTEVCRGLISNFDS